jgi:hypothetical protein
MTDSPPQNPGGPSGSRPSASEALRDLLESHGDGDLRCVELCPICRAADVLRATAPEDVKEQWQAVQREALLTMKAAIDRYVERLEEAEAADRGPRVQDIPIE